MFTQWMLLWFFFPPSDLNQMFFFGHIYVLQHANELSFLVIHSMRGTKVEIKKKYIKGLGETPSLH